MLVAGAGIGTGILTIPYAISKIGVFGTLVALALAYAVSAVMYLIIADLTRNSEKPEDLLAILDEHLFSGKGKKALNIAFLVLLVLLLLENLVVYILCAGNVLTDLLGINHVNIVGSRITFVNDVLFSFRFICCSCLFAPHSSVYKQYHK